MHLRPDYATCNGPPRAARNLDDWTADGARADRELDAAIESRERTDRERRTAIRDVYAVAELVLEPVVATVEADSVPRRLRQEVAESLAARGVKHPSRDQKIREARRILAGHLAAADMETALALTLAAAHLWAPEGGWKAHVPRGPQREGFRNLRHVLESAYGSDHLGGGSLSLDIAQNRARTRSLPGEVFVQASRSSTGRARAHAAVDRRIDAQAAIWRSGAPLPLVAFLFEREVLGRYPTRETTLDELRRREAGKLAVTLPAHPSKGASEQEMTAWRVACGEALWGSTDAAKVKDAALLRGVRDAKRAVKDAAGLGEDAPPVAKAKAPPRATIARVMPTLGCA